MTPDMTPNRCRPAWALAVTWFALTATQVDLRAQKMPAPADDTRIVQLHDMHKLVQVNASGQRLAGSLELPPAARREHMQRLVSFAKAFVQPPLAGEEDISSLSGRYLVALGRPQQQAWIEGLLRRNLEQGYHQVDLAIKQLELPAAAFRQLVPALLEDRGIKPQRQGDDRLRYQAVLDDGEVARILRAVATTKDATILRAPRILLNAMTNATVESGRTISYIKDYKVQTIDGKVVAHPVHDTLLDGLRIDVSCGVIAKDMLGVRFHYEEHNIAQPIPEFETTIGVNNKVTVQLPTSTTVQLEQLLQLPDGGTALLALTDGKGPQLMFLVRAALLN